MIYKRESIEGPLQAVGETITSVCMKYGKAYCYPSQNTILRLVEDYHGIKMSRRTLNRVLRWLEDRGYFLRIRRHRAGPDGKILFATTLYRLKKKLFIRLNSVKKWADRVRPSFRVSLQAQYKFSEKNEILTKLPSDVDNLWKSSHRRWASPSKAS